MRILVPVLALLLLTGCVTRRRPAPTPRPAPQMTAPLPPPAEPREVALLDGRTGRDTTVEAFLRRAEDADLVVFGELHGNLVGAAHQLEVLEGLGAMDEPVALAMEFFERDVQEDLDRYLEGSINEVTFRERARQGRAYEKTHGPLVLWAKEHGAPVIAANAPRKLVSGYRKFDGTYRPYLEQLSEEERQWLPRRTSTPQDAYWRKFEKLMGEGERSANFFRAQALWDDAMAESVADFRDENPGTRVFLIVGGFHVEGRKGTITKYLQRRPGDRVALLLMESDDDPTLPFRAEDRGKADVLLKVPPPKPRKRMKMPNPHVKP